MPQLLKDWLDRPPLAQLFDVVFLIISVATFRHTANGFKSIEGNVLAGWFAAVAIDVTMYLAALAFGSASGWRDKFATSILLLATGSASVMAQLQFSITHAQVLEVATAAEWWGPAQDILDYRVIWMPFSLPVFALLVSFVGRAQAVQTVPLVVHNGLLAHQEELKVTHQQEQESAKSVIDNLRAAAQSQHAVVQEVQVKVAEQERQLAEADRRVEAAGIFSKMSQQAQATYIIALAGVDERFKTDTEAAEYYGLPAYTISKARKAHRENGKGELQESNR